jgi:hypothetical protein
MGLDDSSVMFLCAAKSMGIDFEHTATIGRQTFFPSPAVLDRVFGALKIDADAKAFLQRNKYGEEFLSLLGARRIESVDVSPYEKATIIHDMNLPLPREVRERFTLVHDGGTIEHVFNIAQAFKNCMEMVRVGGYFTQVNVANNFAGHGFWQFSPELIFRLFSPENGFRLETVLMHEVIRGGAWYLVSDPDAIGRRVELCNKRPTYILTIAKRIASGPVLERSPQQSDYVELWDRTLNAASPPAPAAACPGHKGTWKRHIPQPVKQALYSAVHRARALREAITWSGFSPAAYRRLSENEVLQGRLPSLTPARSLQKNAIHEHNQDV